MVTDPPDDPRFRQVLDERASIAFVPAKGTTQYATAGVPTRRPFRTWLTPIEDHYICHRNPIPAADADEWQVTLTDAREASVDVTVGDLVESHPTIAVVHTMECAGNGRAYFDPSIDSVDWSFEAVSTACWTGTPVRSVLDAHGIEPGADDWLTAVGGDESAGDDVFTRSIPMEKALDDCVLAYGMNGAALPPEHGYPVRLIVPGWYGVNSVKWVTELRVTDGMVQDDEFDDDRTYTEWQQAAYRVVPQGAQPSPHRTVDTVDTQAQMADDDAPHPYTFDEHVKSLIDSPEDGSVISGDDRERLLVTGVAWAGDDRIERVEVSTDGGETWGDGTLLGPAYPNAWRRFEYRWSPEPGEHVLVSRATDDRGRTQPARVSDPDQGLASITAEFYPWNQGGYGNNAYLPHAVTVTVT